jgi:hypothetical protein
VLWIVIYWNRNIIGWVMSSRPTSHLLGMYVVDYGRTVLQQISKLSVFVTSQLIQASMDCGFFIIETVKTQG